MTDILRFKVESALLEGEAHRLRLVSGTGKLMPFLPLASGSLEGNRGRSPYLLSSQFSCRKK